jgi:hypothetical protein
MKRGLKGHLAAISICGLGRVSMKRGLKVFSSISPNLAAISRLDEKRIESFFTLSIVPIAKR